MNEPQPACQHWWNWDGPIQVIDNDPLALDFQCSKCGAVKYFMLVEMPAVLGEPTILDEAKAFLDGRAALGPPKYGMTLDENDAEIDARLRHLQEELGDGLQYVIWVRRKLRERGESMPASRVEEET